MKLDFVKDLEDLHRRAVALEEERRTKCVPRLRDNSLMPRLWAIFNEAPPAFPPRDWQRVFVLFAVCLYSPRCFLGRKMRSGVRKAISAALGTSDDESRVSKMFYDAHDRVRLYRDFRTAVCLLFEDYTARLEADGLLADC